MQMRIVAIVALLSSPVLAAGPDRPGVPYGHEYFTLRGGLNNCRIRFKLDRTGRVAFMGGSITEGGAWREMVCEDLRKRFPQTKFEFINAGISSTGSTPGAFRLTRDVLSKGRVDLLFEEAAVNDQYNGYDDRAQVRGMEGIVRHALLANPEMDVVLLHFADPPKLELIAKGQTPPVIANHEKVAGHYALASIDLALEVAERIKAGEFTWAGDFKNLHPSPFGHRLYARSIGRLFDAAWKMPLPAGAKPQAHTLPAAPLDEKSYSRGRLGELKDAERVSGWKIEPAWKPGDRAGTRRGFVNVPTLTADQSGATLKLKFTGTAVGLFVAAGPDAGVVEFSVDDQPARQQDLFTPWSRGLHIPWAYVLQADLPPGPHELTLWIAKDKNAASRGHACRIVHFLLN